MFVSKLPIRAKKSVALTVGAAPVDFDTHSYPCLVTVASGKAYLSGPENADPSAADGYPLLPGSQLELCGTFRLLGDAGGTADVRVLYYDHV